MVKIRFIRNFRYKAGPYIKGEEYDVTKDLAHRFVNCWRVAVKV